MKLFFYVAFRPDNGEKLIYVSEDEIEEKGGHAAQEAFFAEHSSWYCALGEVECPVGPDDVYVPVDRFEALLETWGKRGFPKLPGKLGLDQTPNNGDKAQTERNRS